MVLSACSAFLFVVFIYIFYLFSLYSILCELLPHYEELNMHLEKHSVTRLNGFCINKCKKNKNKISAVYFDKIKFDLKCLKYILHLI